MRSLSLVSLLLITACATTPPEAPPAAVVTEAAPAEAASAEVAPAEATAAATATPAAPVDADCLAHADLADGTADKVIHRCANCGLGMDGKEEFASQIDGYVAHSCSESCKHTLDADPGAVLGRSCKK